eukprot:TRINITY_DN5497_c1_g1_i1.p1 TRINITY_DN5497_c1_g1~~TRINITY_DN5497_c1_g1_i1.p1  ORF type:complete len:1206 (+),score=198.21 TRINITY_DN5497_c1_g1_i1:34-3618(+)
MTAPLKVSKICVLLTGDKAEVGKGLEVLSDEFKQDGGKEVLSELLNVSPEMKEVAGHMGGVNQTNVLGCLCAAMGIGSEEGRLFSVLHSVLTNHGQFFTAGLAGERGKNSCKGILEFLTEINRFSPALLHHRLKPVIKGPWIGPEAAWKKKRANYDRNLRAAGIQYLLSYPQSGDEVSCGIALGSQNFLTSLCSTLHEDSEDVREEILEGVGKLLCTPSVMRSRRAHAFERNGVADVVTNLLQKTEKAETILLDKIVPALAVPEIPYDPTATIVPNHVLLHILKASSPHKYISHRRLARKILSLAPSLATHYVNHIQNVLSLQQNQDSLELIAALDVIIMVLEAPLPISLKRGYLYNGNWRGVNTFELTPGSVADIVLPSFVGSALSGLLKHDVQLIVVQAMEVVMLAVKKFRSVVRLVTAVDVRQKTFQQQNPDLIESKDFLPQLGFILSGRLPHAGVFLALKLPPSREPTLQDVFRFERLLTVLRVVQIELPSFFSGVNLVKLFPSRLDTDKLSKISILMLFQILAHDTSIKTTTYLTPLGEAGDDKDRTLLTRIVDFYKSEKESKTGDPFLIDACVVLVRSIIASVTIVPCLEPLSPEEVVAWMSGPDPYFFNTCLLKLYNDMLSVKNPLKQQRIPGSPLLRVAGKDVANADKLQAVRNIEKSHESCITLLETPKKWGQYTPMSKTAVMTMEKKHEQETVNTYEQDDVRGYNGTLGKDDQERWAVIKKKLPEYHYQAGSNAPKTPGRPDPLWTQTLAGTFGDKLIQKTLSRYPTDPTAVEDDSTLLDPRYVTLVLAAHLTLCVSRTPPTVPEVRRLTLQGFIPLLVKGLSSKNTEVRELSYTAMGALAVVVPSRTPFALVLEHIKNSCWEETCKLPNSIAGFLSAACEAVYRPGVTHQSVTKYLLKFPYTRRGDWPFGDNVVLPEKSGGMQVFAMQSTQNIIWSMSTARCGRSIGALVKSGVMQGCLTVLQSPLSPEKVRDVSVRTLEAGMAVIPNVMLNQLKLLVPIVSTACTLTMSATGDARSAIQKKTWEYKARLLSMVSIALLNLDENFQSHNIIWDLRTAWVSVTSFIHTLGEQVTTNAALFFSAATVLLNVLSKFLGETPPATPSDFVSCIVSIQKAHALTDAPPSRQHVGVLLKYLSGAGEKTKEKAEKDKKKKRKFEGGAEQKKKRKVEKKKKEKKSKKPKDE